MNLEIKQLWTTNIYQKIAKERTNTVLGVVLQHVTNGRTLLAQHTE